MNESFESSEHEQPLGDGSPLPIEQQLHSFRPRAPQLDWHAIMPNAGQSLSPAPLRTGFTGRQMSLAIAASWLLGAVVGGGCIFWSMSAREVSRLNPSTAQTTSEATPSPVASPASNSSSIVQREPIIAGQSSVDSAAAFNISDAAWLSDEPLGVRSLTGAKPQRLTALRPKTQDVIGSISSASIESRSQAFEPATVSNRQQLMQQYLKNADQQVY